MLPYPRPHLRDAFVELRPWSLRDVSCIREAVADPTIPQMTTVPATYSRRRARSFMRRQWSRRRRGEGIALAVAEPSGTAVGQLVLLRRGHPGVYALGYWLVPDARGRGLAARAVDLLASWALRRDDVQRVEAHAATTNEPSLRTLRRAGFEPEGVLRRHLNTTGRQEDAVMFSRITAAPE